MWCKNSCLSDEVRSEALLNADAAIKVSRTAELALLSLRSAFALMVHLRLLAPLERPQAPSKASICFPGVFHSLTISLSGCFKMPY